MQLFVKGEGLYSAFPAASDWEEFTPREPLYVVLQQQMLETVYNAEYTIRKSNKREWNSYDMR